ncbi:YwqI/YxiC family protein, partial [Bacillus sp. NTK071]|nr:YwqI/YxiC family protein [Bacillus sp. NTK071]MBN8211285.1 YwqI/YxiC family protein [Bacillus sp. NTK071]
MRKEKYQLSNELLVKFNEIEQSISRIEKSLSAFNAELPKNTGEGNNLDVVNRLNELNHMMTE